PAEPLRSQRRGGRLHPRHRLHQRQRRQRAVPAHGPAGAAGHRERLDRHHRLFLHPGADDGSRSPPQSPRLPGYVLSRRPGGHPM
ncbi:hypothetical protein LTR94_032963, partial [Friedmanniomyces endolithicus]